MQPFLRPELNERPDRDRADLQPRDQSGQARVPSRRHNGPGADVHPPLRLQRRLCDRERGLRF